MKSLILLKILLLLHVFAADAFQSVFQPHRRTRQTAPRIINHQPTIVSLSIDRNDRESHGAPDLATSSNRRSMLLQSAATAASVGLLLGLKPSMALAAAEAAQRKPLGELLYTILRVREATSQESRLIRSGKFKDVQRANIKLAVKFMVQNYRLADTFIAASTYLDGTDRRIEAGQVGQAVVQNLITITEYFDSADVQNLKVGSIDPMSGKESLVLKGLDAARKNIDEFLSYFPAAEVDAVRTRVKEENELNAKEFDTSLGTILNLDPTLL